MAIYHFSVKAISRKAGRSAVAAAAYRSGEKLIDNRYGKTQDYTKKFGIEFNNIYAPENTNENLIHRNELWNTVEKVENRKDALLAREFEIAFASELNQQQRQKMLDALCNRIVEKYNVVVDAAIHAPHTENGSDERNYHAHIIFTTRAIDPNTGLFSEKKYRDFSRDKGTQTVQQWRADFATLTNQHLANAGHDTTVDHRSYIDQDNGLQATQHEGPKATELRRQHQNDALAILPDICQNNDAIKISNAEKCKSVVKLQSLDNEITVSESLLANTKQTYDREHTIQQANEIEQAEIRANAFHQKYYDYANQVINKETDLEKLALIKATQADELARQYILDFELLKSVNKEPKFKKHGFFTKIFSKKPVIFYDIEEVQDNLSPTGHFQSIFDGAEQEKTAEIQRHTELQAKQKAEQAQKYQLEKDKRFADFLKKPQHEVDQLEKKLILESTTLLAEEIAKKDRGEIKEVKITQTEEFIENADFIKKYNNIKMEEKRQLKQQADEINVLEESIRRAEQDTLNKAKKEHALLREQWRKEPQEDQNPQQQNRPDFDRKNQIKPKKPEDQQNRNDGPQI